MAKYLDIIADDEREAQMIADAYDVIPGRCLFVEVGDACIHWIFKVDSFGLVEYDDNEQILSHYTVDAEQGEIRFI